MEHWQNRVAVVTGASSGIGAACAIYLANNGMFTVGLARRKERMEALRDQVQPEARDRVHAIKCDIRDQQEIITAFKEIETKFGPIAVLVNNAAVTRVTSLVDDNNEQYIKDMIDTNILAVVNCTREAFRSMKANGGVGHVFLINSISGHYVQKIPNHSLNFYPSTKFALTAMTEVYRQEFLNKNTNIKLTSISPGAVDTEIIPSEMRQVMTDAPFLQPEDVADALIYCLQTPPHVQIHELTIRPMGEMI